MCWRRHLRRRWGIKVHILLVSLVGVFVTAEHLRRLRLTELSSVVTTTAAAAAGFRNLCRCGHGQYEHSIYAGQNVHVMTVAARQTAGGATQQLCRATSSRSYTYTTKI